MKKGINECILSGQFGSEEEKTYCLKELLNQSQFEEGLVTVKCQDDEGTES